MLARGELQTIVYFVNLVADDARRGVTAGTSRRTRQSRAVPAHHGRGADRRRTRSRSGGLRRPLRGLPPERSRSPTRRSSPGQTSADRYISDRPSDKATNHRRAGSRLRIRRMLGTADYRDLEDKISSVGARRKARSRHSSSSARRTWRDKEKEPPRAAPRPRKTNGRTEGVISSTSTKSRSPKRSRYGREIPVYQLTEEEGPEAPAHGRELHKRVVGQDVAIQRCRRRLGATSEGSQDPNVRRGSSIFLGP